MEILKKVLVVDDSETIRDSCRQVLERAGYDVDEAADGKKAIASVSNIVYHLILLDLKMPDMDGLEVLTRIREVNPDTPVVIITGYPSIDSAVEAMRLGASDFVPKPFTPEVLRTITEKVLKTSRLLHRTSGRPADLSAMRSSKIRGGKLPICPTSYGPRRCHRRCACATPLFS